MLPSSVKQRSGAAIHYAQCWEDADILLDALQVRPGSSCLSIASAGDNTLALLSRAPANVLAIDWNPAQLALLELRVAAYRELEHPEMLALIGSIESTARRFLYERCRKHLSKTALEFWDNHPKLISAGIGAAGRFENYLRIFRTRVLPLMHSQSTVDTLLATKAPHDRVHFYDAEWNNIRWRVLFRISTSRAVMGRIGRDPECFRYVHASVAEHIVQRMRYGMTELDPATNPYLCWIFTGKHRDGALPFSLRPENFRAIRDNLDRLNWRCCSLDELLEIPPCQFDCFNLSDTFEYMATESYERILRLIVHAAKPAARLAYWNLLVPRSRPESLASCLKSLTKLADAFFVRDKAFFYSAFVLEEVR